MEEAAEGNHRGPYESNYQTRKTPYLRGFPLTSDEERRAYLRQQFISRVADAWPAILRSHDQFSSAHQFLNHVWEIWDDAVPAPTVLDTIREHQAFLGDFLNTIGGELEDSTMELPNPPPQFDAHSAEWKEALHEALIGWTPPGRSGKCYIAHPKRLPPLRPESLRSLLECLNTKPARSTTRSPVEERPPAQ